MRVELGKPNELKFMLSIKGSTSDPNAVQPTIRFLVTEQKSGLSMCFPMERKDDGMVSVTLPDMPDVFKETAEYVGQVEVIVGGRYFTPTKVGLLFERPMMIEAKPVLSDQDESEPETLEELIQPEAILGGGFDIRNVAFSDKPKRVAPPPSAPKPSPAPARPLRPEAQKLKTKLKSLLVEAWNELEE